MKIAKLLLCFFLLPLTMRAQKESFRYGTFVIKGHVKNFTQPTFDFGITTFLNNTSQSVIVKEDGSFEQSFPIQHQQDIYLYLNNDALTFSVSDKDTIYLDWDEKDFLKTFSIKGKDQQRSLMLATELSLLKRFRKPMMDMLDELYKHDKEYADEKKYTIINDLFNQHVQAAIATMGNDASSRLVLISIYFTYTNYLRQKDLVPRFKLDIKEGIGANNPYAFSMHGSSYYRELNEEWFFNIPVYREFVFNYVRFLKPFNAYSAGPIPFNPTLDEYYLAHANIPYVSIRDWFVAKAVIMGFGFYPFDRVEGVYNRFADECATPYFKDTLQHFYAAIQRLKPGNEAPAFSLKDESGKQVSLSSFKGKVVYLDFWGVGCGPCIYNIKNYLPGIHEKYKDKEVVFINICVDANEREWKAALQKYQLKGVNLIAEGWGQNPVCKAYNISGIPHYVLIDKAGRIEDNNGPLPYLLNNSNGAENNIDVLLK